MEITAEGTVGHSITGTRRQKLQTIFGALLLITVGPVSGRGIKSTTGRVRLRRGVQRRPARRDAQVITACPARRWCLGWGHRGRLAAPQATRRRWSRRWIGQYRLFT